MDEKVIRFKIALDMLHNWENTTDTELEEALQEIGFSTPVAMKLTAERDQFMRGPMSYHDSIPLLERLILEGEAVG